MFILKIVQALEKQDVQFAVCGGFAVALHGAVRGTIDLDLVIALTEKNMKAAEGAMHGLGFECRQPVTATELFHFRQEYIKKKNLVAWSFYNPKNPSEIVDFIITYSLAANQITNLKMGAKTIPILSLEALIKMKTDSGRPQDLEDVSALKKIKQLRGTKNT